MSRKNSNASSTLSPRTNLESSTGSSGTPPGSPGPGSGSGSGSGSGIYRKAVDIMLSLHCASMLECGKSLKDFLVLKGYSVFLCDQIQPGAQYRDVISFHAMNCQAMVAFLNISWCQSKECSYEFNMALRTFLQRGAPNIFPLILEDLTAYDEFAEIKGMLCNINGLIVKPEGLNQEFWNTILQALQSSNIYPRTDGAHLGIVAAGPYREVSYADISDKKFLASGAFGKVYSAKYRGESVAMKELNSHSMSDQQLMQFKLEFMTMTSLRSRYTINLIGACTESPHLAIVMELMEGGTLNSLLLSDTELKWDKRISILQEIAMGIQVLHTNKPTVLHRDLKSANVLLDAHQHCKLADFGFAVVKEDSLSKSGLQTIGTVYWLAPEILSLRPKFSKKSDIYSFAIIMWEVAARKIPYQNLQMPLVMACISRGDRLDIPKDCPDGLKELISQCWHQDPSQRPNVEEIIPKLEEIKQQAIIKQQEDELRKKLERQQSKREMREKMEIEMREQIEKETREKLELERQEKEKSEQEIREKELREKMEMEHQERMTKKNRDFSVSLNSILFPLANFLFSRRPALNAVQYQQLTDPKEKMGYIRQFLPHVDPMFVNGTIFSQADKKCFCSKPAQIVYLPCKHSVMCAECDLEWIGTCLAVFLLRQMRHNKEYNPILNYQFFVQPNMHGMWCFECGVQVERRVRLL